MKAIHYIPSLIFAALLQVLAGCKDDRPMPTPPDPDETFAVSLRSADGTTDLGKEGKVESDKAVITGLGYYKAGETAKVVVTPKEGYTCEGIYFEYQSGYDAKAFPITPETALAVSSVSIKVQGNITVRAIVTEVAVEYAKRTRVNEKYWEEVNRQTTAEIKPRVRTMPYEEYYDRLLWAYPSLHGVVQTDTLYRGEEAILSWTAHDLRFGDGKRPDGTTYRVAYALADMNGEIVEIYPPFNWEGEVFEMGWVVFPTVSEGDYMEKMLVEFPDQKGIWYDIPLLDCSGFSEPAFDPAKYGRSWKYEDYYPEGHIKHHGQLEPYQKEELYYSDKILVRHVVERNSIDCPPIPRWCNVDAYRDLNMTQRLYYTNLAYGILFWTAQNPCFTLELSNNCNQPIRGTLYVVERLKYWCDQNLDVLDNATRVLYEAQKPEGAPTWEEAGYNNPTMEFERTVVKYSIQLAPNETGRVVKVPYMTTMDESVLPHNEYADSYAGAGVVFYWQPDGSDQLYFMHQDNSAILNYLETGPYALDSWWAGCRFPYRPQQYRNAHIFDFFEESQEFGNRMVG